MGETPMLLCYDIRNPRRLLRVHRRSRRVGVALQYSVFYLELSRSRLNDFLEQLRLVIDESEDDVRVYQISGLHEIQQIGCGMIPAGVLVLSVHGCMMDEADDSDPDSSGVRR